MSIAKSLKLTGIALAGAAAVFVAATSAEATTYTPSLADLAGFTQVGPSSAGISTINNRHRRAAGRFHYGFPPPTAGASYANVGVTGLASPFSAGDKVAINGWQ